MKAASIDVAELTLKLCEISSMTGDEAPVVEFLRSFLQDLGFVVQSQPVGPKGRDNLLVTMPEGVQPEILLTTHLDTVPPFIAPTLSADKKWLMGRGVCDAKGACAAMICAMVELLHAGHAHVGLLLVVGEETNSDGAKKAVQAFAPKVKYFINGEPTDLKLVKASKGALVFDLEAAGKAGHSAYPESGHSAVHQLIEDTHQILQHPWHEDENLGGTTVNIGQIEGGVAANVIAASARASGVMRLTEDSAVAEAKLKSLLNPSTTLHVLSKSSPLHLHHVPGFDSCVVAFGSDIPHLSPLGTPLMIGPGSILDAHTDHERVLVADLHRAVEIYQTLCLSLQSGNTNES